MPKTQAAHSISRRSVLRGLGASAIMGLPGCGGGSGGVGGLARAAPRVIDGYADQQSYRPGDRVTLFLNGNASGRASLGLYDSTGNRVLEFAADLITQAPVGPNPWETGFGYMATATITLPNLPSGFYLFDRLVPIIVKTALATPADVVVVYPTNTEAAYNSSGGRSMYSQPERARIVSFQRPLEPSVYRFSRPFVEWMSGVDLPYSLKYVADADLDDYNEISGARVIVIIGHSEYWTRRAREHFDRFVLDGGNALVLSGNTMWWQVRYSEDRSQMICYKEAPDPVADPLLRTINWPDRRLDYPVTRSIGADFPRGGYGIDYPDKGWNGFRVLLPDSPVFRGITIQRGDVISIPSVEYDGAPLRNSPVTQDEPQLDLGALGAHRAEIIGYDYGSRGGKDTVGTWLAYQRTQTSGIVLNGASTDWCSKNGVGGPDGARVRKIILNMLEILVTGQSVFVT